MNPFLLAAAALMAGGCIWSLAHGQIQLAIIYLCYAVANATLGIIK